MVDVIQNDYRKCAAKHHTTDNPTATVFKLVHACYNRLRPVKPEWRLIFTNCVSLFVA